LIRIGALAGEQAEIQPDPEGDLERGAHDFRRRAGPEPSDLLGQRSL